MLNPVTPYRYLLPTVYFYVAYIANPDVVVGSGLVSTSPAGPHGWLATKMVNRTSISGAGDIDIIYKAVCQNRCDSSTACIRCSLEPRRMWSTYTYL